MPNATPTVRVDDVYRYVAPRPATIDHPDLEPGDISSDDADFIIPDATSRVLVEIDALSSGIMRTLNRLCRNYPSIVMTEKVLGGTPRINGVRLAVTDVLSELVVRESIDDILSVYGDDITRENVKDAIRYARDFLDESYSAT